MNELRVRKYRNEWDLKVRFESLRSQANEQGVRNKLEIL